MVADSAFYTQENLQIVNQLKWLSRVPLTVKAATLLVKFVESIAGNREHLTGNSGKSVSVVFDSSSVYVLIALAVAIKT